MDDDHAISFYELRRGTPVFSSDGSELGTVIRAQSDERTHIFDGVVIKTPAGRRFVDAPEIERMTHARVSLTITAAEAQELLPEHRGLRGVLEKRAQRRMARMKRRLPGR